MRSLAFAALLVALWASPARAWLTAEEVDRDGKALAEDQAGIAERRALALKPAYGHTPIDAGGVVDDYMAELYRLKQHPEIEKRLEGTCVSACTLFIAVPQVCVSRGLMLWFHAPHSSATYLIADHDRFRMFTEYPPVIQQWLERTRALDSVELRFVLTGRMLIDLMGFRECP